MEGVGAACLQHVEVRVGLCRRADPRGEGGRVRLPVARGLASLEWAVMVEPECWEARIQGVLYKGSLEPLPLPEGIPMR